MKVSDTCIRLIKLFEGCKLTAYKCPAGIPTIGWGSIKYPDNKPVKLGDTISQLRADDMLKWEVELKAQGVTKHLLNTKVNQNQFDALVSFAYNCGVGALGSSTLIKKVRNNPNDPSIRTEFGKWNKAAGKELAGLTRRRKLEADLYFKPM